MQRFHAGLKQYKLEFFVIFSNALSQEYVTSSLKITGWAKHFNDNNPLNIFNLLIIQKYHRHVGYDRHGAAAAWDRSQPHEEAGLGRMRETGRVDDPVLREDLR